jgi:hypothetical protein
VKGKSVKLKSFNPMFYGPFEAREVEAELPTKRIISEEGWAVIFIFSPRGKKLTLDQAQLEVADFRISEATAEERQGLLDHDIRLPDAPLEN